MTVLSSNRRPGRYALFSLTAAGICSSDGRRQECRNQSAGFARQTSWSRNRDQCAFDGNDSRREACSKNAERARFQKTLLEQCLLPTGYHEDRPNPFVKLESRRARRDSRSSRLLSYFCGRNIRNYTGCLSHAAVVNNCYHRFCEFLDKSGFHS